jgi:hypothetical protein
MRVKVLRFEKGVIKDVCGDEQGCRLIAFVVDGFGKVTRGCDFVKVGGDLGELANGVTKLPCAL